MVSGQRFCFGRDHALQQAADEDGLGPELEVVALETGHHQQVLGQPVEPLGVGLDIGRDRDPVAAIGRQPAEHLRPAVDRRDRRPELVRHDPDEGPVEVLRLALLVEPAASFDGAGEDIGHRHQEVRVVLGERPMTVAVDTEGAPRADLARDGRAHPADHPVLDEHRRSVEPRLGGEVLDHDRTADLEGVASLRFQAARDDRGTDEAGLPTDAGHEPQAALIRLEFEDLGELDPEHGRHLADGRVEERLELLLGEGELAEPGDRGLLRLARDQRRVEASVLDGEGRPGCEVARQRDVLGLEPTVRRQRRRQRDRTDRAPADGQRHAHVREDLKVADGLEHHRIRDPGAKHLVGQVLDDQRLAFADDRTDPGGVVDPRGLELEQALRGPEVRRLPGERERADRAVRLEQVDRAVVRDGRDREIGDLLDRVLEVERGGERGARLGEEPGPLAGPTFEIVQSRALQGRGTQAAERQQVLAILAPERPRSTNR